jgi:hypothetical protein
MEPGMTKTLKQLCDDIDEAYERGLSMVDYPLNDYIEELSNRTSEIRSLIGFAQGVRVQIPTDTMEQEFQAHFRRGMAATARADALRAKIGTAMVKIGFDPGAGDFTVEHIPEEKWRKPE